MKNLSFAAFWLLMFSVISCNSGQEKKQTLSSNTGNDVEVYYFHLTSRCVTCKTIEAEARKNIGALYPDLVKTGRVTFTALNVQESPGKEAGAMLGVNSQTLLIVKGDQKINISNEAFLYAVSKPGKFKEIIKEKIDPLLK